MSFAPQRKPAGPAPQNKTPGAGAGKSAPVRHEPVPAPVPAPAPGPAPTPRPTPGPGPGPGTPRPSSADSNPQPAPGPLPSTGRVQRAANPAATPPPSGAAPASPPPVPVEPAHSPLEREAEQVARHIAQGSQPPTVKGNATIPGARALAARRGAAPAGAATTATAAPAPTPTPSPSPVLQPPGSGEPLPETVRRTLEQRLGTDLSNVRVHHGPEARQTAAGLDARAFTTGRDIWLGPGESPDNLELMAHEVTHVLQQRANPSLAARVMRVPPAPAPATSPAPAGGGGGGAHVPGVDPKTLQPAQGQVNEDGTRLSFASLRVPGFKLAAHRGALYGGRAEILRQRGYGSALRGDTRQREIWRTEVSTAALVGILRRKEESGHGSAEERDGHVFKVQARDRQNVFLFAPTLEEIAQRLTLPDWGRGDHPEWRPRGYQVDHIVELQLANYPSDTWGNTLANMELLDAQTNEDSGRDIDEQIGQLLDAHAVAARYPGGASREMRRYLKDAYTVKFNQLQAGLSPASVRRDLYWRREEVEAGEHLAAIRAAASSELSPNGRTLIFPWPNGGIGKQFGVSGAVERDERNWLEPLVISAKTIATGEAAGPTGANVLGSFTVGIPDGDPNWKPFTGSVGLRRVPGAPLAGYIHRDDLNAQLARLEHKQASPIEVDALEIGAGGGIQLEGRIIPSLPFLHDAHINFRIDRRNVEIYKTFNTGELQVPSPLRISDCSLTVFAGVGGGGPRLGAEGEVSFEIQGLGRGRIGAELATDTPLTVSGAFDFDTRYFDPARLAFTYNAEGGQWTAAGDIGLKPGTLPGIESATGHVEYDGTTLSGNLTVVPRLRAIQQGVLSFSHSEAEGSRFSGTLTLSDAIPNVRSGELTATITRAPGEEDFRFAASGDLATSFAGFNQRLHVEYDNGGFVVEGGGDFERGMLSGNVTIGATNYAVDEAGTRGTEPTDTITAYGSGQVSVRLTPWLTATGRIRLLPNGEIELFGELALPPTLDVFDERSYNRRLFELNLDIPIIGFAVAGQRVGIFATIGAGLDLSAGIGPGQLRDTRLNVTYNPSHEDQTTIHGQARFVVPAHAGLRMFVRGALGAGIPIVSAELGLEAGGEIGLAGEAAAEARVDWSPGRGLVLDATGSIHVQPRFRFDLTGFLEVTADLLVTEIDLYSQRWRLAGFDVGSNLAFGVEFPMHYEEGRPFELDWNQIRFITPDVDVEQMMDEVIGQVV